jgi:hypothetical protein
MSTATPYMSVHAGAMRLPNTPEQQPVFNLIAGLNTILPPQSAINLIPYNLYAAGGNNLVYVNGARGVNGTTLTMSQYQGAPGVLGFPFSRRTRARPRQPC